MTTALAVIIIVIAVVLVVRGAEVRLVLFTAGLTMAAASGQPLVVLDKFAERMADGKIVGPICSAMGFAFVLRATASDQEMVRLLIAPLRRVRWALVPGGCLVGFMTNAAITSQTGAAAAVGPILAPLMLAAGFPPTVVAATLVLGCSGGGNLFNPGEPDIVAIARYANVSVASVLDAIFLPEAVGFAAAVLAFSLLNRREIPTGAVDDAPAPTTRLNYAKAFLPPLPIALIFLALPKWNLFPALLAHYPDGLPVPHAMLIATGVAMVVNRSTLNHQTEQFFEGLGFAYTHVISLIIAASCFVAGVDASGLTAILIQAIKGSGVGALILSGVFPWLLALLSGSGTTPSVTFSQLVLPHLDAHAVDLGIVATIAATFGRTMSPVAAVVIFTSTLVKVAPIVIIRCTAPALAVGAVVVLAVMMVRVW